MKALWRKLLITLANAFLAAAFALGRQAGIAVRWNSRDELQFREQQCGRQFVLTMIQRNDAAAWKTNTLAQLREIENRWQGGKH